MADLTADQVVGNRLKIEKQTTAFINSPGNALTETWKAGFVTPPVYSWVVRDGVVYWQIGELPPLRFVKHDPDHLDVVPDSGGAAWLPGAPEDDGGFLGSLNPWSSAGVGETLNSFFKLALYGVIAYVGFQALKFYHAVK